jgi:predicted metal-dependent HD superfamily phosphohydrolase
MTENESFFSAARWLAMWQALGARQVDEGLRAELLRCYAEPQRHYHSQQHLGECLAALEPLRELAERPAEIELALWFHDAIYDTRRKDNELRSADWAQQAALAAGLATEVAARVHGLVMMTRHQALPVTVDEQILIDVDLSILGANPQRFAEYERQIEQEYAWVAAADRRSSRRRILLSFLGREAIYSSAPVRARLEQRARRNLQASIAALGDPPG